MIQFNEHELLIYRSVSLVTCVYFHQADKTIFTLYRLRLLEFHSYGKIYIWSYHKITRHEISVIFHVVNMVYFWRPCFEIRFCFKLEHLLPQSKYNATVVKDKDLLNKAKHLLRATQIRERKVIM